MRVEPKQAVEMLNGLITKKERSVNRWKRFTLATTKKDGSPTKLTIWASRKWLIRFDHLKVLNRKRDYYLSRISS